MKAEANTCGKALWLGTEEVSVRWPEPEEVSVRDRAE